MIDANTIPLALLLAVGALLAIGTTAFAWLVMSGHYRAAAEADRRADQRG